MNETTGGSKFNNMQSIKKELFWIIHNLIAHPVSELSYWAGYLHPEFRIFGNWLHDSTVPSHEPGTGRG